MRMSTEGTFASSSETRVALPVLLPSSTASLKMYSARDEGKGTIS